MVECLEARAAPSDSFLGLISLGAVFADPDSLRASEEETARDPAALEEISSSSGPPGLQETLSAFQSHEVPMIRVPGSGTQQIASASGQISAKPSPTDSAMGEVAHRRIDSPFNRLHRDLLDDLLRFPFEDSLLEASQAVLPHSGLSGGALGGPGSASAAAGGGASIGTPPPSGGAAQGALTGSSVNVPPPRPHGAIRSLRFDTPPATHFVGVGSKEKPGLSPMTEGSGGSGGSGGEVPIAYDDTGPGWGGSGGIVFMNDGAQNPYFTSSSNDYDIRSNDIYSGEVTITKKDDPSKGTATISQSGLVTYTPNTNEYGSDALTYTLSNEYGESNEATICVVIAPHLEFISDTEDANSTLGPQGSEVYLPNNDEYEFKISPLAPTDTAVGTPSTQQSVFTNCTYEITAGNSDGFFKINSSTGQIQLDKPAEDWETDTSKTIDIEVSGDFADITETDTASVTVTLLPLVGIAGDIHAVEDSADDINFRIARPKGDRSEAVTVYFTIAWASDTASGLHPDDFSGSGHAIFSGPSVTYHEEHSSGNTACYSVTIPAGAYYTAQISMDLIADSDTPPDWKEEAYITPIDEPSSGGSGGSGGSDPPYVLSSASNQKTLGELPGLDAQDAFNFARFRAFEAVTAFGGDPEDDDPPVSITVSDVDQGVLGDCWLMATILGAVRKDTDIIKGRISETDSSGDRAFAVTFYNLSGGGETTYPHALASENLLRNGYNMAEFDGYECFSGSDGHFTGVKIWPQLLELAFTQHLGSATYGSIEGEYITNGVLNAWKSLTNSSGTSKVASTIGDGGDQAIYDEIQTQFTAGKTVLIGTYGDHKCENSGDPLSKSHTYVVKSVQGEPDEKIELDNPWHGGQLITWIAKDRLSEEVKTVYILD